MAMSEFEQDLYKDSVNILGVSIDELEDFINPSANMNSSKNISMKNESDAFIMKLE